MSAPLMPSPLDYIGRRCFAFHPPVRHASPNAWLLGTRSRSEVQVINSQTGRELWVPRQFIGAVGDSQGSLLVGLTQDLQLQNGEIVPRSNCRVMEMPVRQVFQPASPHEPARVVAIRLEPDSPAAFQSAPVRVGIVVLFIAGLIALLASTSHVN